MSRGKTGDRGQPGPRGDKGERGEPGAIIVGWKIDRPTYCPFPVLADGQLGPELNLRELFEQYLAETQQQRSEQTRNYRTPRAKGCLSPFSFTQSKI